MSRKLSDSTNGRPQMNPYYAFSAIFGLGLRGIQKKMKLPYGPVGSPGVTRETLVKLPTSLESATAAFSKPTSIAPSAPGTCPSVFVGESRDVTTLRTAAVKVSQPLFECEPACDHISNV